MLAIGDNSKGQIHPPELDRIVSAAAGAYHTVVIASETSRPWIFFEPSSQRVQDGMRFRFNVHATGSPPLAYQWQYRGENILDATNSTFAFSSVQLSNSGAYSVVVTNPFGSTTSRVALLDVMASMTPAAAVVWGRNPCGAQDLNGLTNIIKIAASAESAIALLADRSVRAWGCIPNRTMPPPPDDASNIVDVTAGYYQFSALSQDGRVISWSPWGSGSPADLTNTVAISAGRDCTIALRANGTIVTAWGQCVPPNLRDVVAISAGMHHFIALHSDGTVTGWGENTDGQIDVPEGLSNVVSISAGGFGSCALKRDGALVIWGYFETYTPPEFSEIAQAAHGITHMQILQKDGLVKTWGFDVYAGESVVPSWLSGVTFIAPANSAFYALTRHPIILSNPQPVFAWPGTNAISRVTAGGLKPLQYQWEREGVPILGATKRTLVVSNVQAASTGNYRVRISNPNGSIVSAPVPVILVPQILTHPRMQIASTGRSVTFKIRVSGTEPFAYTWYKGTSVIAQTTAPALTLSNVQPADAGSYRVSVQNAAGAAYAVHSDPALLKIVPPLTIQRIGSRRVELSWPAGSKRVAVQWTPTMAPSNWRDVTELLTTNKVLLPFTPPQGFYRLRPALPPIQ